MIKLPSAPIEDMVDPDQDSLSNVYFDRIHGRLIAADGFGMVMIPVAHDEKDVSGPIPVEIIKFAREFDVSIGVDEPDRVKIKTPRIDFQQPRCPEYPNVERITSKALAHEEKRIVVSLDASRLLQIARALLDEAPYDIYGVTLEITEGGMDPIIVKPYVPSGDERFGILMPMARRRAGDG